MAQNYDEFTSLSDVYGTESEDMRERYVRINQAFTLAFGDAPELFSRAPGRVNLIGEHIDYEGYGVLPMAICSDTVVAIRKGGTKLVVSNLDTQSYATTEFETDPSQEVNTTLHTWANYFLAAYKGVWEFCAKKGLPPPEPTGLQVLIHGLVPTGAGLSSSAAFVVSCTLAVMAAHGLSCCKGDLAELTALSERHVGVVSGGMDQAISVMAQRGVACYVEFNPTRATAVSLPEGGTFVIANSLAHSHKADTAATRYNLRVVECRLASAFLAIALGVKPAPALSEYQTLRDVEPLVLAKYGACGTEQLEQAVADSLHEESYSHAEVEESLGVRLADLYSGSAASLRVLAVAAESDGYKLRQRALHVWTEAARVLEFKSLAEATHMPHPAGDGTPTATPLHLRPAIEACKPPPPAKLARSSTRCRVEQVRLSHSKNQQQHCLVPLTDAPHAARGAAPSTQDADIPRDTKLTALGALMDLSHNSCDAHYQCSCAELNALVGVAKAAGALGSRLTGAGWGGCTVSLVRDEEVQQFLDALHTHYFLPLIAAGTLRGADLHTVLFATKPSSGAAVLRLAAPQLLA
ncbi:MAG: hypothetical protein WDW38_001147 [Sanguina aurantia]